MAFEEQHFGGSVVDPSSKLAFEGSNFPYFQMLNSQFHKMFG